MSSDRDLAPTPSRSLRLLKRTRAYVNASKADNTKKTYRAAWKDFAGFCAYHRTIALPASPETVAAYITLLADGQKVSTLQVKLAAIAFAHRAQKLPDPTRDERVTIVMEGIRRTLGVRARGKPAILREQLVAMTGALSQDLRGQRDRAILLFGFAGAWRRSELVSLQVEDLLFRRDAVVATIRRSKTDQTGEGATKTIPMLDAVDADLCPVRALQEWLRAAEIGHGPILRAIDQYGHVRKNALSAQSVGLIVKQAARAAGLDVDDFSAHGLRVGFVSQAAADGIPDRDIQSVTLHKSLAMVGRYNREKERSQVRTIKHVLGSGED